MSNVIEFKPKEKVKEDDKKEDKATDLDAVAEANKKNDERVAKERLAANKSVLRSYRIKTK